MLKDLRTIGIVIPAFNNGQTIGALLQFLIHVMRIPARNIIVVNDGSTDNTSTIASRFNVTIVQHVTNCGVGVATKSGFEKVLTMHQIHNVIKLDSDGQHDPERMQEVIQALKEGSDLVICSRFYEGTDQSTTPPDRLLLNQTFASIVSAITGWDISDARSGFMGMSMEIVRLVTPQLCVRRYGIPINLLLALWDAYGRIGSRAKVGCVCHQPLYSGSSLTQAHQRRYQAGVETKEEKTQRFLDAWAALEFTCIRLGLPYEQYHEEFWPRVQAAINEVREAVPV